MGNDSNNRQPLVSIIIPVYNVKDYLEECLESVANQTYGNTEVLLIDDGSTDGSGAICEKFAAGRSNFQVKHFENSGLSASRNRGLKLASGEFVIFLDSDDWIDEDTCEIAVKAAVEHGVDVVIWSYVREYDNHSLKRKVLPDEPALYKDEKFHELYLQVIGPRGEQTGHPENLDSLSSSCNKLYKKAIAESVSFVDTKIIGTEDLLFNILYFQKAKSAFYIDRYFLHYRKVSRKSLTKTFRDDFLSKRLNLFERIKAITDKSEDERESECFRNRVALDLLGNVLIELISGFSFSQKREELKKNILHNPLYEKALADLDLSYMPFHWKVFYFFGKRKNATMLLLMGKAVRRIKKRV